MKHRDIDFHIYSSPLTLAGSFQAMAKLAENTSVKKIECTNLLHTIETCMEWHAWYQDSENEIWDLCVLHIYITQKASSYLTCKELLLFDFLQNIGLDLPKLHLFPPIAFQSA